MPPRLKHHRNGPSAGSRGPGSCRTASLSPCQTKCSSCSRAGGAGRRCHVFSGIEQVFMTEETHNSDVGRSVGSLVTRTPRAPHPDVSETRPVALPEDGEPAMDSAHEPSRQPGVWNEIPGEPLDWTHSCMDDPDSEMVTPAELL